MKKRIWNKSKVNFEDGELKYCPVCKGDGFTRDGSCDYCKGHGMAWVSINGWILAKYSKDVFNTKLY